MIIDLEKLRYPIGPFIMPDAFNERKVSEWIQSIEDFPQTMHDLTNELTEAELNYHYRPDGWMIKQVVHHCADSHMNSLIRFKLALTEERPTIRPYMEERWALLPDSLDDDVSNTLILLKALHKKLVFVLRQIGEEQWTRTLIHPATNVEWRLFQLLAQYAWHSEHHLAHVRQALNHNGNFDNMQLVEIFR